MAYLPIGFGTWSNQTGLSVPNGGAPTAFPMDTEIHAYDGVIYTPGSADLTIVNDGLYAIVTDMYSGDGWAAGAIRSVAGWSGASTGFATSTAQGPEGSSLSASVGIAIVSLPAGATVSANGNNQTGTDATFFADIAILRIG